MKWWPFWCILMHLMCDPMTPPHLSWLISPFKCSFNPEKDHIRQIRIWTNMKLFALSWYGDHFGPFWCVLVHFGAPHVWPHDPSMACTDSYRLSSVNLIQKKIIWVTQDKFEKLLKCHDMVTILVHFGPFWCTSCATPWPLSIEFSRSHQ